MSDGTTPQPVKMVDSRLPAGIAGTRLREGQSDIEDLTDRIYQEWMRTSRVMMEFLLDNGMDYDNLRDMAETAAEVALDRSPR